MSDAKLELQPENHQIGTLPGLPDVLELYKQVADRIGIRETARLMMPLLAIVDGDKEILFPELTTKRIGLKKEMDWLKKEHKKTVAIKVELKSAEASIAKANQIRPNHSLLLEAVEINVGRIEKAELQSQQSLDSLQREEKITSQRILQVIKAAVGLATGRKTLADFESLDEIRQRRNPITTRNLGERLAAD